MSNVIQFDFQRPAPVHSEQDTALAHCFSRHRRIGDDVFWLKENAEFLNIYETAGARFSENALEAYRPFYDQVESRLRFFPQYYRFLLSITLDLEALGMKGDKGAAICEWAHRQNLAEAELSDLQRAEAARLLSRGGVESAAADEALKERMRRFASNSATFSLPNKKAAYELTHIVFYLSEYGRRDPELSEEAIQSLMFAGTLAFIDENTDLLAEVCVALRFAGRAAPQAWDAWAHKMCRSFSVAPSSAAPLDDYHEFLILNWLSLVSGRPAFEQELTPERLIFTGRKPATGALRAMSEYLYQLDDARVGDWNILRGDIAGQLGEDAYAHVLRAEEAYDDFGRFFELFARASS